MKMQGRSSPGGPGRLSSAAAFVSSVVGAFSCIHEHAEIGLQLRRIWRSGNALRSASGRQGRARRCPGIKAALTVAIAPGTDALGTSGLVRATPPGGSAKAERGTKEFQAVPLRLSEDPEHPEVDGGRVLASPVTSAVTIGVRIGRQRRAQLRCGRICISPDADSRAAAHRRTLLRIS